MKSKDSIIDSMPQANFPIAYQPQTEVDKQLEAHKEVPLMLYIGCGISILLVILVGITSLFFSNQQKQKEKWVEHTYLVLNNIEALHHHLHEMAIDKQGYRITGKNDFLQDYNSRSATLFPTLNALDALVKDNPSQLVRIKNLRLHVNDLLDYWKSENNNAGNALSQSAVRFTLGEKAKVNELSLIIDTIVAAEHKILAQRENGNIKLIQITDSAIIAGTLLILMIVSFLIYLILRELKYRLIAYQKEKEMNQFKSSFVSLASHEFRTPLSSIFLSASLIEKYRTSLDAENVSKHCNKIKKSVSNLTGILEDFLSLEKLDKGKITANLKPFDLVELCEDIIEEMYMIVGPNQQLRYEHVENDRMVNLDSNLLRNTIINLISNSVKYAGDQAIIILQTYISDDQILISIKDNGIGIAEKDQKDLFTPFYRVHHTGKIPGTGLGLNIVLRYVKLMNGNLKFTSTPHQETCFKMTFPTY